MKKIIMLLMMFALLPLVSAIYEGQIITQAQLDNINVGNINAQYLECEEEERVFEMPQLRYRYSCLNIMNHGEDYIIYRDDYVSQAHILEVGRCILESGFAYCEAEYQTQFQNQFDNRIQKIKDWILTRQTSPYVDIILQWFANWSPF